MTKEAWLDSQQVQGTYLYSETSRPVLGPTQFTTQFRTVLSSP
jgi:hypothetical protein